MDTLEKRVFIRYSPPLNRFEKWRERTWPRWAKRLWPIRWAPPLPLTYDQHAAGANRLYFMAVDGPYLIGPDGAKKLNAGEGPAAP